MSSETMIETTATANSVSSRPLTIPSPGYNTSPSPPSTTTLASSLLAAVSQVQSFTSQLPPSVQLPTGSPPGGVGGYRTGGLLGTSLPQLHLGSEPPMSSLLAGLKDFPRPYHSPPPLPSSESHECKIVEVRGAKVAAFIIGGETMLCLPQAFELFLKHLVGGLHTVYTKLKRLGIEPLVCNVDQVRILRGLGAIQPGVNRCKLLSVQHFDILYRDCTTASSRPGRPPKRASDFMTMTSSPETLFDLKKRHLENGIGGGAGFPNGHIGNDPRLDKSPLLANGYHAPPHFNPLQYMAHHMAGLGYPHLLPGGLPGGMPGTPGPHPHPISPPEASPMKQITPESLARMHEERVERERQMMLDARRGLPPTSISALGSLQHHHLPPHALHSSSIPPTPCSTAHDDHQPPTSPILNLSKTVSSEGGATTAEEVDDEGERDAELRCQGGGVGLRDEDGGRRVNGKIPSGGPSSVPPEAVSSAGGTGGGGGGGGGGVIGGGGPRTDDDRLSDMDDEEPDKDEFHPVSPSAMDTGDMWSLNSSTPGMTQLTPPPPNAGSNPLGFGNAAPLSSTEVLLRNILGLLRVAEENARHHERQTQFEKAELKMEVLRERELRETLEKQLQEEQKNRILMQKRCAKLKKLRRRLQERLDLEVKRRSRYEDHIRSASPDVLNDINGSLRKDMEAIAAELQQENLHHQQQQHQLEDERNKESTDRLLASPSLANHPAVAAATAVAAGNSWR